MFPIDATIAANLALGRTEALTVFFGAITHLGDVWFSIFAASLICFFLYTSGARRYVPELFVIAVGSALTVWVLKILFAMPRPLDPIALITIDSFSFPSGHAAAAATLYGFLIWIIVGAGKIDRVRMLVAAIFFSVIVLVGFSRLYLGVHYLSDVIAGYFVGFVWLGIGILLARHFKRKM